VAGAVFDPESDECIEGAKVTLRDIENGKAFTTKTDNYGDFWIKNLKKGLFSLSIEKKVYKSWTVASIDTEKDVHLGDVELLNESQ